MPSREIAVETRVAAPVEKVWAVMADVERWPEWTPSVRRVEKLGAAPMGVGARARVWQPKLPPAVWTVTDWREGRGFIWESRGPGTRVVGAHEASPDGDGCRVRLSVRFEGLFGGLMAALAGPMTRRYVEQEAAGLKARAER